MGGPGQQGMMGMGHDPMAGGMPMGPRPPSARRCSKGKATRGTGPPVVHPPSGDGSRAHVVGGSAGQVVEVDVATGRVGARVRVGRRPHGVAVR